MRHLVHNLVEDTLRALREAGTLQSEVSPAFSIDAPKNPEHGDYACNVAMMLAKPERKKPRDIAQAISDHLVDADGVVEKLDIAGPGFLNFKLKDAVIFEQIRTVLAAGDQWGRAPSRPEKVMVEFVSANPTGPLHLGHARGAFMGDAVARLLSAAGYDVTREFYINDAGRQVETLGRTVHKRYRELYGETVELEAGEYPAAYVIDIAKTLRDEDGDKWRDKSEDEWLPRCIEIGIRENIASIKKTLEGAGITHDVWFAESALHEGGEVAAVADAYKKLDVTYEAKVSRQESEGGKVRQEGSKAAQFRDQQLGGTFLETSKEGDEEDRVILRPDGSPVYLTADLAYHRNKAERGFHRMIDVWGADHAGHVPRIRAGMKLLGYDTDRFDFLLVQMVRLMRDGDEVKQSKRSGEVLELAEVIEDVGPDAIRFIYLMRAATSQFDFDLDLAKKNSADNPVFYAQMGHARCVNVLKKADEMGVAFGGLDAITDEHLAALKLPEERAMVKKIAAFPDVVIGAAEALEPHRLLYAAQELIAEFHSYFGKYKDSERIVSDNVEKTQGRLALVAALRNTLKCALNLLGITAPDYMTRDDTSDDEDA